MYTASQVVELTGVPYRTLMRWAEEGVIEIEKPPAGRGKQVLFNEKDVREIRILGKLRGKVSFQKLRKIRDYLRNLGFNPFSQGKFLVIGEGKKVKDVVMVCDREKAFSLLNMPGQLYLIVPLGEEDKMVG